MKRRAFLSLFGSAAAAWPLSVRAATGKRPVVGFMVSGSQATYTQNVAAFVQRMRELGWTDGDNVAIVYRWAEGVNERYAQIAAEFIKLKVDVIVTSGSEGIGAAKRATAAIPIVFAVTADPVPSDWLKVSRTRAATSPVCRVRRPTLPAKRSNYCGSWSPDFNGWRSSLTPIVPV